MAVYNVNQVRHLYVVTTDGTIKSPSVITTDKAGAIAVKKNAANDTYFQYMSPAGLVRSDLLTKGNVQSIKVTDAADMARKLKAVTLILDDTVNGGNPVAGQDYLVRIHIRQYIGMSDQDVYIKHGVARAYAGMTASELYKTLALSLANNFKRELYPLVDISLIDSTNDTKYPVLKNGQMQTLEANKTYKGILINEVPQEWFLGTKQQVPVYFTVQPDVITVDGDSRIWGVVEDAEPAGVIDNGKNIADLEYFCMGERGDIYRNISWPDFIPTKYLANPTLKYNTIDIHYAYVGANQEVQKSEKDLTIAIPSTIDAKAFITAIQTNTGVTAEFTAKAAKNANLKAQG